MSTTDRSRRVFSWLQLSDIHIEPKDATHRADQPLVLDALERDLRQTFAAREAPPNAIFVTGDLAFSGAAEQYTKARAWLEKVANIVGVPFEHVYVVAGNHDVQRQVDTEDRNVGRLVTAHRQAKTDTIDDALEHSNDRAMLVRRMAGFVDFIKKLPWAATDSSALRGDGLWWVRRISGADGLRVRIVGFNSALLSADDHDKGVLQIGKAQLSTTLTDSDGELVIVMSHHPLTEGWIAGERGVLDIVHASAHVHLCGHVHEASTLRSISGGGGDIVTVTGGAVHGDKLPRDAIATHGYNFAEVRVNECGKLSLRVWPRRWSRRNADFRLDIDNVKTGEFVELDLSRAPTLTVNRNRTSNGASTPSMASPVAPRPDPVTSTVSAADALPYLASQARRGKLSLLIGPGASIAAGLRTWTTFGEQLRAHTGKVAESDAPVAQMATVLVNQELRSLHDDVASRQKLLSFLDNALTNQPPITDFGAIYPRLAALPVSRWFVTTWDDLAERALITSGAVNDDRRILYLHGSLQEPQPRLVLTAEDHQSFARDYPDRFQALVEALRDDGTLLCVGFSAPDLGDLQYLKTVAPAGRIYALMSAIEQQRADNLYHFTHAASVTLATPSFAVEAATVRFLDALQAHIAGNPMDYVPPQPVEALESARWSEAIRLRMDNAAGRAVFEGLRSPVQWFSNWRDAKSASCAEPPQHALLDDVFIDCGLLEPILAKLRTRSFVGITGLLGIGGVGKTYLAMKIAGNLRNEGWDVAWVGLLHQGVDTAVDLLADCFDLRFAQGLQLEEKQAALRALFKEFHDIGRKVLVVYDNAELFPDLGKLLEPCKHFLPVLVTSRMEERADLVTYKRLNTMDANDAFALCSKFLNKRDPELFSNLGPDELQALRGICEHLGGHPLAICLVLAGFVAQRRAERRAPGRLVQLLDDLRTRGLDAIPDNPYAGAAPGDAELHRTIYATFTWLYADLEVHNPTYAEHARQLLPIVAAVAATGVPVDLVRDAAETVTANAFYAILEPINKRALMKATLAELTPTQQALLATVDEAILMPDESGEPQGLLAGIEITMNDEPWPEEHRPVNLAAREYAKRLRSKVGSPEDRLAQAIKGRKHLTRALTALSQLPKPEIMHAALDVLDEAAMVESDARSRAVRVHPLVREYAFHLRKKSPAVTIREEHAESLVEAGPTMTLIHHAALEVLQHDLTRGESLLDVLQRFGTRKDQAEHACSAIEELERTAYYRGHWELSRRLLETGLQLANNWELAKHAAYLLAELGELLDRMELPHGRAFLQDALIQLHMNRQFHREAWVRTYLDEPGKSGGEEAARQRFAALRASRARMSLRQRVQLLKAQERKVLALALDGPSSLQAGLAAAGDPLLSNVVLDLLEWAEYFGSAGLSENELSTVRRLVRQSRALSSYDLDENDRVSPKLFLGIDRELLLQRATGTTNLANVQWELDRIGNELRQLGLRGFEHEERRWQFLAENAALNGDWTAVLNATQKKRQIRVTWLGERYSTYALRDDIEEMTIRLLLVSPDVAVEPASLRSADVLCGKVEERNQIGLLPWVEILRALYALHRVPSDPCVAAQHLHRSEELLKTRGPSIEPYMRAILREVRARSHATKTAFTFAPDAVDELPDVNPRPWAINTTTPLPLRVRSRIDGTELILIEGGLQRGMDATELWSPPFYIDAAPLGYAALRKFTLAAHTGILLVGTDGSITGISYENACAYAEWAGRRLPTVDEWFAATWQMGFGNRSEKWHTWEEARARWLHRIEGIITERWSVLRQETPAADLREESGRYWNGAWLEHPEIERALATKIVAPLLARGTDHENARTMARGLALSLSLTIPEKQKIVAALPGLLRQQIDRLLHIFAEEGKQFREIVDREKHAREVLKLGKEHSREFIQWLMGGSIQSSFEVWPPLPTQTELHPVELTDVRHRSFWSGQWLLDDPELGPAFRSALIEPYTSPPFSAPENMAIEWALGTIIASVKNDSAMKNASAHELHLRAAQSLVGRLGSKREVVLAGAMDRPVACWSDMHSDDPNGAPLVVVGDPFERAPWFAKGVAPAAEVGLWTVGVRTVLPIWTRSDLENVEPLE